MSLPNSKLQFPITKGPVEKCGPSQTKDILAVRIAKFWSRIPIYSSKFLQYAWTIMNEYGDGSIFQQALRNLTLAEHYFYELQIKVCHQLVVFSQQMNILTLRKFGFEFSTMIFSSKIVILERWDE